MAIVPQPRDSAAAEVQAPETRAQQTLALIRTLLDTLSAAERERFYHEIIEKTRSLAAPRAGEVLGTIVRLLPQRKLWSVAELRQQIDEQGVPAEAKEIYNAITYLARRGRVRRIGYGRYLVDGMELATTDDLGGETARHEDAYRVDRSTE